MQSCPNCKISRYCSPVCPSKLRSYHPRNTYPVYQSCQSADEQIHKSECEAFRRLLSTEANSEEIDWMPGEAVRAVARIIWRRKEEGEHSVWVHTQSPHTNKAFNLFDFSGAKSEECIPVSNLMIPYTSMN